MPYKAVEHARLHVGWGWLEGVLEHGTSIGRKATQLCNVESRKEKRGSPAALPGRQSFTGLYLIGND